MTAGSLPEPVPRIADVDGIPMSALVSEAPYPRATVIAIHGGGTTSGYFDCPGHPRLSLLRIGAALGFTVIALDRPGFGSSAAHADLMNDSQRRVDLAYGAVDGILDGRPHGAGLFLVGHSNGCELTLRMAVRRPELLGLEFSGTGRRNQPIARDVLNRATISDIRRGVRELLWQATHLYPAEAIGGVPSGSPAYEGAVIANWPQRDFPDLAAKVKIPVRFTLADHEPFWESGPTGLADVAAMFTASPRVVINEQRDSGHNLSMGLTAAAYHLGVFAFIEECIVANESTRRPDRGYEPVESEAS